MSSSWKKVVACAAVGLLSATSFTAAAQAAPTSEQVASVPSQSCLNTGGCIYPFIFVESGQISSRKRHFEIGGGTYVSGIRWKKWTNRRVAGSANFTFGPDGCFTRHSFVFYARSPGQHASFQKFKTRGLRMVRNRNNYGWTTTHFSQRSACS